MTPESIRAIIEDVEDLAFREAEHLSENAQEEFDQAWRRSLRMAYRGALVAIAHTNPTHQPKPQELTA